MIWGTVEDSGEMSRYFRTTEKEAEGQLKMDSKERDSFYGEQVEIVMKQVIVSWSRSSVEVKVQESSDSNEREHVESDFSRFDRWELR